MSTLVSRRSKPTVGEMIPGLPTCCRIAPERRRADVVRPEDDVADARREARPRRRLEPADEEAGDDDGVVEHR